MMKVVEKKRWRRRSAAMAAMLGLALLPKCVVCVAGYVAVLGGVGAIGAEWCGGEAVGVWEMVAGDAWLAVWLTIAVGTFVVVRRTRRNG